MIKPAQSGFSDSVHIKKEEEVSYKSDIHEVNYSESSTTEEMYSRKQGTHLWRSVMYN